MHLTSGHLLLILPPLPLLLPSRVSRCLTPPRPSPVFQEGACRGFYNRDTLISTLNIINTVRGTAGALPVAGKEGRTRAFFLVSLRDPERLWGTGVPFEVQRSWMGKYTRRVRPRMEREGWVPRWVWMARWERGQGVRCSMIRGLGYRWTGRYLNLNAAGFEFVILIVKSAGLSLYLSLSASFSVNSKHRINLSYQWRLINFN